MSLLASSSRLAPRGIQGFLDSGTYGRSVCVSPSIGIPIIPWGIILIDLCKVCHSPKLVRVEAIEARCSIGPREAAYGVLEGRSDGLIHVLLTVELPLLSVLDQLGVTLRTIGLFDPRHAEVIGYKSRDGLASHLFAHISRLRGKHVTAGGNTHLTTRTAMKADDAPIVLREAYVFLGCDFIYPQVAMDGVADLGVV
jgi:hypothetical protein